MMPSVSAMDSTRCFFISKISRATLASPRMSPWSTFQLLICQTGGGRNPAVDERLALIASYFGGTQP
jgi:hypothetical protein